MAKTKTRPPKVTDKQAIMLAQHAMYVQGGVSDPERERKRAEEELAGGAVIDWDKMQAEIEAAIAADKSAEVEAAELEGLAPMPEDMVALRDEANALRDEIDRLNERRNEIKETFGKYIEDNGLQGLVLHGKVHARVTYGTRHGVDSKKLKEEMPHIWSRFLKATKYRSVTVN